MIELFLPATAGMCCVRQELVPPVIYLDTWALREFAEDAVMGARFRAALLHARGTLALSDINLVEFTTFESRRHTAAAGQFVDSIFPHVFLMRNDPTRVIERELEHDESALIEFAQEAVRRGGRFSMAAWFGIVHQERVRLSEQLPAITQVFFEQLKLLREQLNEEPRKLALASNAEEMAVGRPATYQLAQSIINHLQRDHSAAETQNNAVDLLHTIVPGAYCDFVLLDGQWADRLQRAVTRLSDAGIPVRLRASYSKRNGGVERFLQTLEAWPVTTVKSV